MKKLFIIPLVAMAISASTPAMAAPATDNPLSGLLNGLKNTGSGSSSDLGNALGGIVSGLISTDKVDANKIEGTWKYTAPAVCFQSDNLLQKAGGAAIAGTIEGKLEPYYTRFGLDKLTLTIDKNLNFTMVSGKLQAGGTVEIDNTDVYFHFSAIGKISLGKVKTYVTVSGSEMSIMFDVSKLMSVIKTISSVSSSSAIQTATSLLDSYDGICAGFKLKKQ